MLKVGPYGSGENASFDVFSDALQVIGTRLVGDPFHILFDDGAFVQIHRGVVGGCSDHFHAPLPRSAVGIAALKGGQESVVDIDDPSGVAVDEILGKDPHVPGKDHQIDMVFVQLFQNLFFLFQFLPLHHGEAEIGDAEAVGDAFQIRVIADDEGDLAPQILFVLRVGEKIVQAVGGLGNQNGDPLGRIGKVQRILQRERSGEFRKGGGKLLPGGLHVGDVHAHPHEVEVLPVVGVLLTEKNVESPVVEVGGNPRKQSLAVHGPDEKYGLNHVRSCFLHEESFYYSAPKAFFQWKNGFFPGERPRECPFWGTKSILPLKRIFFPVYFPERRKA